MTLHRPSSFGHQHGAALAFSLLMLVIVTLLGIAAMRATQVELKLSQNAESRMSAQQNAESINAIVISAPGNVPVNDNPAFVACFIGSTPPVVMTSDAKTACASQTQAIDLSSAAANLQSYGYAVVQRVPPLFVQVNVMRDAAAGAKDYDFARYNLTGGYDRSSEGLSAAEVTESMLVLHIKPVGLTYE